MFCKNCGKELPENVRFCTGCGTQVPAATVPEAPVQPAPAAPVQQTPVTPVAPVAVEPKKKKKGLLITLLIVIPLVLALVGVGIWLVIDKQNQEREAEEQAKQEQQALETAYEEAQGLLEKKQYDKALEAFKNLGDYEDCEEQVEKLEQFQKDYDAAQELVTEKDYEAAVEAFEALEDYRDSAEMVEKGIPYEIALDEYDEAESIKDYLAVAEAFEELSGYNDADEMASMAYLNVCKIYLLEENDVDSAMEYAQFLNEAHAEGFQTVYKDNSADSTLLADLEQALEDRINADQGEYLDYSLLVKAEWDILDKYEDMYFIDERLETLFEKYIVGLELQTDSLDGTDYPYEMVDWYKGAAIRCEAINELYDEYDFIEDNDELCDSYIGMTKLLVAYADIQEELEMQMWGVYPELDNDGYYLAFANTTDYDFSILFLQRYGTNDGSFVGPEFEHETIVKKGETIRVPLEFPADLEYDVWYIDWAFADIYDGNDFLG